MEIVCQDVFGSYIIQEHVSNCHLIATQIDFNFFPK